MTKKKWHEAPSTQTKISADSGFIKDMQTVKKWKQQLEVLHLFRCFTHTHSITLHYITFHCIALHYIHTCITRHNIHYIYMYTYFCIAFAFTFTCTIAGACQCTFTCTRYTYIYTLYTLHEIYNRYICSVCAWCVLSYLILSFLIYLLLPVLSHLFQGMCRDNPPKGTDMRHWYGRACLFIIEVS